VHAKDTTLPRAPDRRRYKMAHPWLTRMAHGILTREAAARGVHPDKLAARVIEHVAGDNLWSAVLDR
jgi:hypothetical protein